MEQETLSRQLARELPQQQLKRVLVDLLNARMALSQDLLGEQDFANTIRRRLAALHAPSGHRATVHHSSAAIAMVSATTTAHMQDTLEQMLALHHVVIDVPRTTAAFVEAVVHHIDDFIELVTRVEQQTVVLDDPRRLADIGSDLIRRRERTPA